MNLKPTEPQVSESKPLEYFLHYSYFFKQKCVFGRVWRKQKTCLHRPGFPAGQSQIRSDRELRLSPNGRKVIQNLSENMTLDNPNGSSS